MIPHLSTLADMPCLDKHEDGTREVIIFITHRSTIVHLHTHGCPAPVTDEALCSCLERRHVAALLHAIFEDHVSVDENLAAA